MNCVFAILFALVSNIDALSLSRSKAFEDFEKICENGESVNGFTAFVSSSSPGKDLRIMVMCKAIDPSGTFETGECRDADEFDLFYGDGSIGENLIGSSSNCAEGEYLAGLKSTYESGDDKASSVRKVQYHCCLGANAEVDEETGCNHIGPMDPFDGGPFFILQNMIFPRTKCPRDALSGVEISSEGIAMKYCPYKIEGLEYSEDCYKIKEDVETFEEMEGIAEESVAEEGGADSAAEGEECICVCATTCEAQTQAGGEEDEDGEEGTSTTDDSTGSTDSTTTGSTDSTTTGSTDSTTTGSTDSTTSGSTESTTSGSTESTSTGSTESTSTGSTEPTTTTEAMDDTTEASSGSSSSEEDSRRKREANEATMTITTEERDGVTVWVMTPSLSAPRCPEEQCNCGCEACGKK